MVIGSEEFQKARQAQAQCGQTVAQPQCEDKMPTPPTLYEQAAASNRYYAEQSKKAASAADFFARNPAFDEFILLIRRGAIQI